jgi:acetate kinase
MLLVVNAGSSSLKLAVFDQGLKQVAQARQERIGPQGHLSALQIGLQTMGISPERLQGAAHRVVHGGADLTAPCRITAQVIAQIEACVPLAPLHNPANLIGIRALSALAPDLPQYASFDTAFHASNPAVATTYALPKSARDHGLRRYGFHGLSYASIVRNVGKMPGAAVPRLLAFHLGNGASLCAILNGRSIATTMGYSPLDGMTMGTRAGEIDGNAVLRLADLHGIARAGEILNRESGLLALGGAADMRALHQAATPEAEFAIAHFAYWALRHAGSMIAALGGLDAIAFTGGIGENDAGLRGKIIQGLGFIGAEIDDAANTRGDMALHATHSNVAIWTIPAEEELQIALEASKLMQGHPA